jgi:hypothetical protein
MIRLQLSGEAGFRQTLPGGVFRRIVQAIITGCQCRYPTVLIRQQRVEELGPESILLQESDDHLLSIMGEGGPCCHQSPEIT